MDQILIIVQVFVSVIMVALVLMQNGKGAEVGASFGGGSSNTMFGSQGAMPFLMKITVVLAVIFFATNLTLSRLYVKQNSVSGRHSPVVMPSKNAQQPQQPSNVIQIPESGSKK